MPSIGPVVGRFVVDIDDGGPGDFEYYEDRDGVTGGLLYVCPCGCGAVGALNFQHSERPRWQWDGNRDRPTLTPSVHHKIDGRTHWHGFLTGGVWKPVLTPLAPSLPRSLAPSAGGLP